MASRRSSFGTIGAKRIGALLLAVLHCSLCVLSFGGDLTVPRLNSKRQVAEIPFKVYQEYLIVVEGKIGELEHQNLLLDTGSNPSMIDRGVASKLGLQGKTRELLLFNKSVVSESTSLPDLQFGPLRRQNLQVMVIDLSAISNGLGTRIDAVIGLDVLGATNFTVDYTKPVSYTHLDVYKRQPNALHNFAPVLGFAWTPNIHGDNKTVIRGGFRLAYDPAFYNMFLNVGDSAPSVNLATLFGTGLPTSGFFGTQVIPYLQPLAPKGNPGFDNQAQVSPNFRNPYSEQWNLGFQRSFTNKIVGEVRYVGNHGVHLFQILNSNPALGPLIKDVYKRQQGD